LLTVSLLFKTTLKSHQLLHISAPLGHLQATEAVTCSNGSDFNAILYKREIVDKVLGCIRDGNE
jgi:hypothetical protein